MNFPKKRYNIIYADPPWSYKDKNTNGDRGAACKYDTMSLTDIMLMPIDDIASKNCALFMWVTNPLLAEGLATMRAWGFEYKTVAFNWVKLNKKPFGLSKAGKAREKYNNIIEVGAGEFHVPFFGLGHYTRSNSEICIVGVRGKMKRQSGSVTQEILTPVREHSRKPDEARQKIVELYGDVPRIELFARQEHNGWDAWGNQL